MHGYFYILSKNLVGRGGGEKIRYKWQNQSPAGRTRGDDDYDAYGRIKRMLSFMGPH